MILVEYIKREWQRRAKWRRQLDAAGLQWMQRPAWKTGGLLYGSPRAGWELWLTNLADTDLKRVETLARANKEPFNDFDPDNARGTAAGWAEWLKEPVAPEPEPSVTNDEPTRVHPPSPSGRRSKKHAVGSTAVALET